MVRTVRTPLYGVRDLDRALKDIGEAAGTAVMEEAMIEAAAPLLEGMKTRVRYRTGKTHDLLKIWRVATGIPRKIKISVGAAKEAFWARYLEFGTAPGRKKALAWISGRRRRQYRDHSGAAAFPFARPAWEAHKVEVLNRYIARLRVHLQRIATQHAAPRHPKRR